MSRIVKAPDERRSELIACAQRFFYTKGYASTSISDIIDAAGVAKGTFYYYFDSKQAVLEAMIDELLDQSLAILQEVIADETLSAIPKWKRAFQVIGSWKTARKDELIGLMQVIMMDENVLLRHKMTQQTVRVMAPQFARIIRQGVDEGVFDTPHVSEAAEIVFAVWMSMQDAIAELVLESEKFDDPLALAQSRVSAIETAIERTLGAPSGSLTLIEPQIMETWFKDQD